MATNERFIAASRQRVFAVLADGWAYSNWVVATSHMRAVEQGWPAVGSRLFHAAGSWPITTRDETVVEEMVPDERLALLAKGRPIGEARVVLELADANGGCHVTMHETPVAGPGKWLHNPLAEKLLVRRNTESLDRLAAIAEQRAVPSE
ncbi:SRPBCC family protein [uncultured Jatrophihabitans sp.]|uniref:SRPBCC family protein n=1 Tax=uncultured Jatrophihabitans sp. TaxID=1610747 RepID=UPI0035CAB276